MLQDGCEVDVPVAEVALGEVVVVRPGERIPVDGRVSEGQAPVDQAAITGESMPVDKAPGDPVFAATIAQAGFLKVQATRVGADTTFAGIARLVEEAEVQKAPVQRFADRFSAYYLPAVLLIAAGTYVVAGQVLNAVAVVVVACACAIAFATPVVVLASVGHGARRGMLIKGGLVLEQLARVNTVAMDKTGTLTWGEPRVTDVVPLAHAIVRAAAERGLTLLEPESVKPLPGRGLIGTIGGRGWTIGTAGCWLRTGA